MSSSQKKTTKTKSKGVKYDGEKPRYDLIPPLALDEIVRALTYGAQKYDDDNWRLVEDGRRRYFAAMMRHAWAYWRGEVYDPETGIHHLAHAACNLLFILDPELEE